MTRCENPKKQNTEQAVGASGFVTEAYNLKDPDNVKAFYAKWADDYDHQMTHNLNYVSPEFIARAMQQFLVNKDAKILDMGCGTGLTASQMFISGYTQLYGIDLSAEMVKVAAERGIYTGLKTADINHPLDYDDDAFDGVISSGTFTHGHVGAQPLAEIFRILKPDGILACTVHRDLWQGRGFEQVFKQMQDHKKIRCLSREFGRYYANSAPEGWFCVYQKTAWPKTYRSE